MKLPFFRAFTLVEFLVVISILGVLCACLGCILPIEFLFYLCFGWIRFLGRVLPEIQIDWSAVVIFGGALVLFVAGLHGLLRSIQQTPWRLKWTLSAAGLVLLMFVAGISFVGVTHQAAWMAMANEPMVSSGRDISTRMVAGNNLKMIALGLQNHEDTEQTLPPGVSVDAEGRSLHSWMTLILPYIEQRPLHDQIKLDRRWDDPAQGKAFDKRITVYESPAHRDHRADAKGRALTHFSANQHVLGGTAERALKDFPDGASNTILAGEAAGNFVPWGKPGNWRDPARGLNQSAAGFGSNRKVGGVMFSFADGHVQRLDVNTSREILRALATPGGGETVDANDY